MIDLIELQKRFDKLFEETTPEQFEQWLCEYRKKHPESISVPDGKYVITGGHVVSPSVPIDVEGEAEKWVDGLKMYHYYRVIVIAAFKSGYSLAQNKIEELEKEIERLKGVIKWACDNPQSVFVFDTLSDSLTKKE